MPAALPPMSSQRRRRVVMRRCSVPFWRSMMSAMPAVMRLNRMKFTIMPGELRMKPLGVWPAAAPASTTLVADGRVLEGRGDDRPRLRGRLRDHALLGPGRHAPRRPDRLRGGLATPAPPSPALPASERISLATVEAPLEPWVETIVRSACSPEATAAL